MNDILKEKVNRIAESTWIESELIAKIMKAGFDMWIEVSDDLKGDYIDAFENIIYLLK